MKKHDKTRDIEQILKKTATHTDEQMDIKEPSIHFFENMVQKQTEAWYKRLWIEMTCLWIIAVVFLSSLAISVMYTPLLFIGTQVLSTLVVLLYFIKETSRTVASRQ
ncbi:YxlC family protein [Halobacillus sp. H74]|uniref:YxlC family protein n=1 Tax=Halobacillus sp. H74 TaxID=3457436 RepID=UPI003FCC3394